MALRGAYNFDAYTGGPAAGFGGSLFLPRNNTPTVAAGVFGDKGMPFNEWVFTGFPSTQKMYHGSFVRRGLGVGSQADDHSWITYENDFVGEQTQVKFEFYQDGSVEVWDNFSHSGTMIASAPPGTIPNLAYGHRVVMAVIDPTNGEVYLEWNGSVIFHETGLNTNPRGSAVLSLLNCEAAGQNELACHHWFDDTTNRGRRRTWSLRPTADGAVNDGTPSSGSDNFAMVNDNIPATLSTDTTKVTISSLGDQELYEFGDLPATVTSVDALILNVWGNVTDAALLKWKAIVRSGGGTIGDGPELDIASAIARHEFIMETNPVTTSAFTPSEVNGYQFGIERT